jgi:hypothetical protein
METLGNRSVVEFVQHKIKNIQRVFKELQNTETNPPNYPYDDFMKVMMGLPNHNAPVDVTHTALDTMYWFAVQNFTKFLETFIYFLRYVKEHREVGITEAQHNFYNEVFTIFANAGKLIPK